MIDGCSHKLSFILYCVGDDVITTVFKEDFMHDYVHLIKTFVCKKHGKTFWARRQLNIYNGLIASEVKIKLSEFYDDETEIFYCRAVGIDGEERICKIPLYELDMQEDIDYLTSIYIPKDDENKKDIYDLLNLFCDIITVF